MFAFGTRRLAELAELFEHRRSADLAGRVGEALKLQLASDIRDRRIFTGPRELEGAFEGRRSIGHVQIVQETAQDSEVLFRGGGRNKPGTGTLALFTTRMGP